LHILFLSLSGKADTVTYVVRSIDRAKAVYYKEVSTTNVQGGTIFVSPAARKLVKIIWKGGKDFTLPSYRFITDEEILKE
jgi:hypothetical protein